MGVKIYFERLVTFTKNWALPLFSKHNYTLVCKISNKICSQTHIHWDIERHRDIIKLMSFELKRAAYTILTL